jgi:phospholipid/cholesterol/gamma-HCH transport system substrate-binding protein
VKSSRNYPAMQMKVGTLLAVALSVTLLALIFPTKGVNPFSSKIKLVAYFPEVSGLRASSPVWFSGVEVGSVKHVDFVPESDPPRLKVVIEVEKKIQGYLKTDSKAMIQGMGLLGDMYIDLIPGSKNAPQVENGTVITGVPPEKTKEEFTAMMASAKELLANLNRVSQDIANGQGSLGLLVKDPALYRELQQTVKELRVMVQAVNSGEGTAGELMRNPALYDEMVAAVKDIRAVVNDLKNAENKILSPETKEAVDQTVKTASRVVKRVGEIQEKMDLVRFDLNFGLSKYLNQAVSSGHADLVIWPNRQRYYQVGIEKVSGLYGNEKDKTTFNGQLAWRIFQSPLFIRGGLTKSEYFIAGLDMRLWDDKFKVMLDTYRVELNPAQVDVRTGVVLIDILELTAGAEDVLRTPFYKAGLTLHYQDDDLLNVIFKTQF